jgi:hypothetical protein
MHRGILETQFSITFNSKNWRTGLNEFPVPIRFFNIRVLNHFIVLIEIINFASPITISYDLSFEVFLNFSGKLPINPFGSVLFGG